MRPRPALRRAPVAPVSHLDIVPVVITWSDGRTEDSSLGEVRKLRDQGVTSLTWTYVK